MKIRILSDLHVDLNKHYGNIFKWDDRDILTILAGDTSGDLKTTKEFVRKHFDNAILIGGNHIVYNDEGKPIQELYDDYRAEFPLSAPISFLENDYKVIGDVVFIGATLWTDYACGFCEVAPAMSIARTVMNDFVWGKFARDNGSIVTLDPDHCFNMFYKSRDFIKVTYDKFKDSGKKIVLITHHGVSPRAVARNHRGDQFNAAYTSDLEEFIIEHMPDLALIIHGHVHNREKYKIGKIPVICNPFGYAHQDEHKTTPKWEKNLIVEV